MLFLLSVDREGERRALKQGNTGFLNALVAYFFMQVLSINVQGHVFAVGVSVGWALVCIPSNG